MLNNVKSNNHVVRLTLGVPDKRENIASQHFADIEFYSLRDLVGRGNQYRGCCGIQLPSRNR